MALRKPSRAFFVASIASIVAVIAIGWSIYLLTVRQPTDAYLAAKIAADLKTMGLTAPVVNSLDPAFKDANGDLIADPPTDPSKFIDPDTLVFNYVATDDPTKYRDAFKDLCDALAKATGKKVRYELITSSRDQIAAMRDGKLQIAGFSTGAVPVAVDIAGFVPVCMLGSNGGTSGYHMEIIVPADSNVQVPGDLKGKELALTEPTSNSGYKAPLVILARQFNLLPGRDFGVRYSDGHNQSIDGIKAKKYAAAAVADDLLNRSVAAGAIGKNDFRVIFTSELFPTAALGYVYNLKPQIADQIKSTLLRFDWKGTSLQTEFDPSGQDFFMPVDYKEQWDSVRKIDDAIGRKYQVK